MTDNASHLGSPWATYRGALAMAALLAALAFAFLSVDVGAHPMDERNAGFVQGIPAAVKSTGSTSRGVVSHNSPRAPISTPTRPISTLATVPSSISKAPT